MSILIVLGFQIFFVITELWLVYARVYNKFVDFYKVWLKLKQIILVW